MIRGTGGGGLAGRTVDGIGVRAHVRQREPLLIAEESLELRASVRVAVADHVAFARLRRRRRGRDEVLVELERGKEMSTIEEIRRHRVGVERRRRRRHRRPGPRENASDSALGWNILFSGNI